MRRTSPGHALLWRLYVIPFLFLPLFLLALIATPAYLFVPSSRPLLRKGDDPNPRNPSSPYEWYGANKDYPPGLALVPYGRGPGVGRRVWEMYGYFREFGHMSARQGLQVMGVIIGAALLVMQVEMMWHDYSADSVGPGLLSQCQGETCQLWIWWIADRGGSYRLSRTIPQSAAASRILAAS